MKFSIALMFILFTLSASSFAQGDTLQEKCHQSMIYTISTQVAGNPVSNEAKEINTTGALSSGKFLGVNAESTKMLIGMSSKDQNSKNFALKYQTDKKFADSFRNSFISGCHKTPSEYLID